ncbi:protein shisa-8 [Sarcophilus harrisii]|uniref:protein shisa-8 n=1 Tax=Sarcophilus harrisii TaxID=9305 RepID=UPI00130206ED|nr:protein shisa-8 [Sarcophilus harrisii]
MPMARAAPWRPLPGPLPLLLLLLLLLASGRTRARAPVETKAQDKGEPKPGAGGSPSPRPEQALAVPSEPPGAGGDRCLGYYDVMGQWDPPFNCSTGPYHYCCGTCGYRFCCRDAPRRLDQSRCSNYDTPSWLQTGSPRSSGGSPDGGPGGGGGAGPNPTRDRAHVAVYSVCGVVALLALGAILTRLGLDKAHSPRAERAVARTLTDLLKQPGQSPSAPLPPPLGSSVQMQMADSLPRAPHRAGGNGCWLTSVPWGRGPAGKPGEDPMGEPQKGRTPAPLALFPSSVAPDKKHLNNAPLGTPMLPTLGLGPSHGSRLHLGNSLTLQPDYPKYNSLKAFETAPGEFYKRFPSVDVPVPSTVSLPPRVPRHHKDLPLLLDGCPWATPGPRAKGLRSGARPPTGPGPGPPTCQGWATARVPPRTPHGPRAQPSPAPRRPPAHGPQAAVQRRAAE